MKGLQRIIRDLDRTVDDLAQLSNSLKGAKEVLNRYEPLFRNSDGRVTGKEVLPLLTAFQEVVDRTVEGIEE